MAKPYHSNETSPKKLLSKLQTQFQLGSDDLGLCQCQQEPSSPILKSSPYTVTLDIIQRFKSTIFWLKLTLSQNTIDRMTVKESRCQCVSSVYELLTLSQAGVNLYSKNSLWHLVNIKWNARPKLILFTYGK